MWGFEQIANEALTPGGIPEPEDIVPWKPWTAFDEFALSDCSKNLSSKVF